ncbi:MAG: dicarboxylate/amino acid:cation symporter [Cryomorphaceae bacterium]|nr:dicarboxylate/amino acid:cation symporter [Flavobacteriales bacterium]
MKNLPLHWKIIIGLVLGIIWAFAASALGWNQFTRDWIDPFGVIFIRILKFIAVPLVLFSIISGISGLKDISKLGRLGAKTLGIYLVTTIAAVGVGLLLVNLIKPGALVDEDSRIKNRLAYEAWADETEGVEILDGKYLSGDEAYAEFMDDARIAAASGADVAEAKMQAAAKAKEQGPLSFLVEMVPENIVFSISNNALMLQVIFFAIFFGVSLAAVPDEKVKSVKKFIDGTNEVFLKMVDVVMQAAPFFVFALMAGVLANMADTPGEVFEIFIGLGSYSIVLTIGLAFMIFVFYPLILISVVKEMSYKEFFKRISPAQFLAFSTSSSAATLPVTMECVEQNIGVSRNITGFVLPIGATVNMDGTSLYQAVAVIFLAQLHMVDLSLGQQLTIVLTATLASIGSAAVPSAGLVMLIIVLQSVGLNPLWIAIIFPVDRILDMIRTVVNVTGDATVSTVIAKSEGELNYQP